MRPSARAASTSSSGCSSASRLRSDRKARLATRDGNARTVPVMADLADHAYGHAGAVLGPVEAAIEVATAAVRRGGRSRWAVLGHARDGVLLRAAEAAPADLDAPAPDDLTELATALAATRPAIDRVVVDLEARHGLDRGSFARALGLPV